MEQWNTMEQTAERNEESTQAAAFKGKFSKSWRHKRFSKLPTQSPYSILKSVDKFKNRKTLGVREILNVDDTKQQNGKVFKKFKMNDEYKWLSYEEVLEQVDCVANGLLEIGVKSGDKVIIYSETRREWLISAFACFKIKATVVTLYSTLGLDALSFGIHETNSKTILTSGECVQKLKLLTDKIPQIERIVVFTDKFTESVASLTLEYPNKKFYSFNQLIHMPKNNNEYESSKLDDTAIIMYTSGTTGNPKGVMITHRNFLTASVTIVQRLGILDQDDIYISYLPLAHIFELLCEITFLNAGCSIGYSNPLTLSDASTGIYNGQLGDLRVLKPTLITCVPTVLERLSKGVQDKLSKESEFKKILIKLAAESKLELLKLNYTSYILDSLIFKKINKMLFGGRLKGIICGGAILNKDLHEFCQVFFCQCNQVYGLTETCGGGTTQFGFENEVESLGSIIPACEIRLVNWLEGNYRVSDEPNPRGEIWIGGDCISKGYYNNEEKTNEDYHVINGMRYFATGDIGEMQPNGSLKIVDRKKDLVKLQAGEYVSLNKVESVIKLLPFVTNCCVIADARKPNCICLISPDPVKLEEYLNNDGNKKNEIHLDVQEHCRKHGLASFEIPLKSRVVKEIWLPDTGLVTDSLKLKRKEIEKFYQIDIKNLYSSYQ
ncbi:unnamed protein product [Brachionus calyciflorus]|uniref:long-chain-fatty-acid--CoA ligase n=1 Tax=Brachionus calyciflorus TaxID=104777 RepID=A0A813Y6J1_9BILA|nr:unnamed protein product [Brachionus calyciflorus]